MNENIKVTLGFLAGALISGVATYIFTEKKLSQEFELALDEYKASVENAKKKANDSGSSNKDDKTEDDTNVMTSKTINDIPEDAINAYENMQRGIRKAREKKMSTDYGKLSRNGPRRDLMDDNDTEHEDSKKVINNRPIVVPFDEYDENKEGYRQVELYFSERDYKLFNDDGEEIDSPDIMVGYENLDKLSESDESDVYIRNDNLKEYYLVTKEYMY